MLLGQLRSEETRQRRALVGVLPPMDGLLETAPAGKRAAVDIDLRLARTEPEPLRRRAYRCDALSVLNALAMPAVEQQMPLSTTA